MGTDAAVSPSLATAFATLRARGLELRRGSDAPVPERARPAIGTGHPTLDAALGTAGWPRGALALLDGPAGSGGTTLALGAVAACQAAGGLGAWLDVDRTFDPAVAARLGVGLEWLLVARPRDAGEAIDLAGWLARSALIDLMVVDFGVRNAADRRALDRLGSLLARTAEAATLLLAPASRAVAGASASVRVGLRRTAWLAVRGDVVGQRVHASVERTRWALAGGSAELDLWFGEGRRIDPLAPALAQPTQLAAVDVLPVDPFPLRAVGA